MSACQTLQTHSPVKNILNKIGDSYQTFVNYYKTYTMATCYGGIGKPLEKDSDPQEIEAAIQDEYQTGINDLENIEPDHHAGLRDLTPEIEQLWHTVEAYNNDPLDAISHLEGKLNQLALILHLPTPRDPLRMFCINTQTLHVMNPQDPSWCSTFPALIFASRE